jgi:starch-binding outer membrane protein, SusD/RagB family
MLDFNFNQSKMTIMNQYKFVKNLFLVCLIFGAVSCKKQLDVGNPNLPTVAGNVNTETGIIALAQGGVYLNGFLNGDGWLGNSYFSLPYGYAELMGDVVGADASNNQITTIGYPDYFILDDGTKTVNPSPQIPLIRTYNIYGGSNNNPLYNQWLNMYALNGACNQVLSLVDGIKFSGDATSRSNTIKAWCYWWKGYAYASVGTMYYSGLINDQVSGTNNHYLVKDSILARSNYYLNLAATTISAITSASDYSSILGSLIPAFCQVGHGGVLTKDMWNRNINTMLARNLLLNKLSPFVNNNPAAVITKSSTTAMTTADWTTVLNYATKGVQNGDLVFTGRAPSSNGFFTATGGTAAALTTGPNTSTTFKIGMRYIQDFNTGDKRLAKNFKTGATYKNNFFGTPYSLIDSLDQSTTGSYVIGGKQVLQYEVYIAGSYEENALMLAEANMRLGNIEPGLAFVDAERTYQGAGVAAVAGTGLTLAGALNELTRERRAALIFRGLSFYDIRRWGWSYDISNGGGSFHNELFTVAGVLNTNVTIDYDFLDYWDVPADETVLNPPGTGSAPVKNPNF